MKPFRILAAASLLAVGVSPLQAAKDRELVAQCRVAATHIDEPHALELNGLLVAYEAAWEVDEKPEQRQLLERKLEASCLRARERMAASGIALDRARLDIQAVRPGLPDARALVRAAEIEAILVDARNEAAARDAASREAFTRQARLLEERRVAAEQQKQAEASRRAEAERDAELARQALAEREAAEQQAAAEKAEAERIAAEKARDEQLRQERIAQEAMAAKVKAQAKNRAERALAEKKALAEAEAAQAAKTAAVVPAEETPAVEATEVSAAELERRALEREHMRVAREELEKANATAEAKLRSEAVPAPEVLIPIAKREAKPLGKSLTDAWGRRPMIRLTAKPPEPVAAP